MPTVPTLNVEDTDGDALGDVCDRSFIRSDSNGDENPDIADGIYLVQWLFLGGPLPEFLDAADAKDDGALDIADPFFSLNHQFRGGTAPPPPYPDLGFDTTPDNLACFDR